ncbi:MAG TPA: hypothetical protein VK890_00840 [Bacteroidia bacterium]|jgi:hypothetical protein|nr:hypothetical protein [Bacteroidia bacterium]
MKRYRFKIEDDVITDAMGEIMSIPEDFIELKNTFGIDRIYYKIQDTKITEVIGEGFNEWTARRRVGDFLASMNINIF